MCTAENADSIQRAPPNAASARWRISSRHPLNKPGLCKEMDRAKIFDAFLLRWYREGRLTSAALKALRVTEDFDIWLSFWVFDEHDEGPHAHLIWQDEDDSKKEEDKKKSEKIIIWRSSGPTRDGREIWRRFRERIRQKRVLSRLDWFIYPGECAGDQGARECS